MTQKTQTSNITLHITKHVETRFNVDLDTKGRIFFCRTYLPESALLELFASSLHYAYIYHNLEDKAPHFHFIVHYENAKTIKAFANLVERLAQKYPTDEGVQKSFVEIPANKTFAFQYLTHTDPKSKKEGKTVYSSSLLIGEGFDFFDSELKQTDSVIDILDDIINGVSFRVMAGKYGRSFVTQYSRYKEFAMRMKDEENPRCIKRDIHYTLGQYEIGLCSSVVLLGEIIDMIAFDLNQSENPPIEKCIEASEFKVFLENIVDIYDERQAFYRGLEHVEELHTYGHCALQISKSRGITDAVKNERWTDFEGAKNA